MNQHVAPAPRSAPEALSAADRRYMSGFGNSFETESLPGALPIGRNSPQRPAYGLYAEQLSGSPFTAPQATNQRSWLYRIRPTVKHTRRFRKIDRGLIRTGGIDRDEHEMPIGSCAGTRSRSPSGRSPSSRASPPSRSPATATARPAWRRTWRSSPAR